MLSLLDNNVLISSSEKPVLREIFNGGSIIFEIKVIQIFHRDFQDFLIRSKTVVTNLEPEKIRHLSLYSFKDYRYCAFCINCLLSKNEQ